MVRKKSYLIKEVSKLCNISPKTLRFYDKIGLLASKRNESNNYRQYTHEELLRIPIIQYFKIMGFTLKDIDEITDTNNKDCFKFKKIFQDRLTVLGEEIKALQTKEILAREWYAMITEAEEVIQKNITHVSCKWIPSATMLSKPIVFDNNYKDMIVNIDWMNHVTAKENTVYGYVMVKLPSMTQRLQCLEQEATIMQHCVFPCDPLEQIHVGGCHMISCYHIGSYETLPQTYEKILKFSKENNYVLSDACYERYLTEQWLTENSDLFVTEILVPFEQKQ